MNVRLPIWKGMEYREPIVLNTSRTKITIRPLCQIELDQCYADALSGFTRKSQEVVVKIHAGLITSDDVFPDDAEISDIQLYYNEVRYHMLSASTGIDVEDLKNLPAGDNLKEVVSRILRISGVNNNQAEKDINWFMTNSDGYVLAQLTAEFKIPITDAAWKLTPLQYRFLDRDNVEQAYTPKTDDDLVNLFRMVAPSGERSERPSEAR